MAMVDVFSDEWCKTWEDKVRESKTFSEYNKGWQGDIGCVMYKDPAANLPEDKYLYLDFEDGTAQAPIEKRRFERIVDLALAQVAALGWDHDQGVHVRHGGE